MLALASAGLLAALAAGAAEARGPIERIEPPFWWAGMAHPGLQLMVHGRGVAGLVPSLACPGVRLASSTRVANPNYLFLDLELAADLAPGDCEIRFRGDGDAVLSESYRFAQRRPGSADREGFSSADVIYLITPDRFANGDPANDSIPGMFEGLNRELPQGRHGGDLDGIIGHLDYIADLGITQVWLNPVLENEQPDHSYHGYSTTDYYKVDPRLGGNDAYRELSSRARQLGMGLIMDMIPNHIGSGHWWMQDLPTPDWLNHGHFVQTTHVRESLHDPHAPESDKAAFADGWFVPTMPDLNQTNPLLSGYLIQNAVWWVEFADLSGIRVDTWSYAGKQFLSDWTRRLMAEYPNFNIVGEEWIDNPAIIAYWQRGKERADGYTSDLPSLMDFPLNRALRNALVEEESRQAGLVGIYRSLGTDFLYADPDNLLVFADNHDMSRIFTRVEGDTDLFRMAMVLVLTTRGIPQLFYGTEILMGDPGATGHGTIRADFPGGWPGDGVNGFSGEGLSPEAAAAQRFLRELLKWRRSASAITGGALTHYAPRDGTYVYFRHNEEQRVMVVINKNNDAVELAPDRFQEMLAGATEGVDALTGREYRLDRGIDVAARGFLLLEF